MRFKFKNSEFFHRMLLALVLVLLGCVSADAQCNAQQTFELLPDDGLIINDHFGWRVGISGTTAIVGVNGDDDNGSGSGSAYLFDTTTGQQTFKLLPNDGAASDEFGIVVAISGTTAIVGVYRDHDNGEQSGSAYLFDTTTGQQTFKLLPDDGAAHDHFGRKVAINGTTAIVSATGNDDNGENSGSAYLFDTTTGQQTFKLLPDDGAAGDGFGSGAISGTTAIVGAGGAGDDGENSGSAYLFDTTTGEQIAKLLPNDGAAGDSFGPVAISGTTAIVGAGGNDDNGVNSGAAYLFDTVTFQQIAKLLPEDGATNDQFGVVAISGNIAIVGARLNDDNGENSGSAYLFDTTTGQQIAKILPDDGAAYDEFGIGVAISGNTAIVGAPWNDDYGSSSGSAYLFDISCDILLGDVNLDGVVDLLDVAPFVDLLISGDYQAEADINQDGVVDLLDVQPFVDLLTG